MAKDIWTIFSRNKAKIPLNRSVEAHNTSGTEREEMNHQILFFVWLLFVGSRIGCDIR